MINLIKAIVAFIRDAFAKSNAVVYQDMVGNTTVVLEDDEIVCWPYGG